MDFLEGLNPQQREAVAHTGGPLLILAGAGSGKTRVITHRIAHLIDYHRVPPAAIVAVTFTNKAAGEMRERVQGMLAGSHALTGLLISTFHSFCVRLLRRDGQNLAEIRPGFTRNFTIYDEDDQLGIIKAVYRHMGLDEKQFMQYRAALSRISHSKNRKEGPSDVAKQARDPKSKQLAAVFEEYDGRLRQANALDFDDLLLESVRLLRHDARTRQAYDNRIVHLLIDEYQDTNRSQYELMRLLTGTHQNVCVVGDEDQSIYSWRGADIHNILDFERDYPNARTIRLEQNYRSTKNIIEAAGAVVANNLQRKGKTLWTAAPAGSRIGLYEAYNGENEADFIAETAGRILRENPADHVAVLYRTNFQSRQIEQALHNRRLKYKIIGGFSFYQRAEVKDVLAYLKAILSPQDSINLLRIINTPARGIGKSTVEEVERFALEHGLGMWSALEQMLDGKRFPTRAETALEKFRSLIVELRAAAETEAVDELVRRILDRTGYLKMLANDNSPDSEARVDNVEELQNAAAEAAERGESAADFLDQTALVSDSDDVDERVEISLLTVHNAKGLEFPVVFLAGMEEGLFPHIRSLDSPDMMEEERRLCYVGMTRARKRLYLTYARQRRRWGGGMSEPAIPSRFLSETPSPLMEDLSPRMAAPEVELGAERILVRESVRKNNYTGKTYNSLENIAEFFGARGLTPPPEKPAAPARVFPPRKPAPPPPRVAPKKGGALTAGKEIEHPRYGKGIVIRREGEGDDAKLTVSFPGYGLKKLVAKYAGLKNKE
jgi:DNA helicase-2/ATP-dependent DNA helicase PcrA